MKDMKESLTSGRKADITHVRGAIKRYIARACEYGSAKYERGNFLRNTGGTGEDFERLRKYLRATISHIDATLDAMERHQAGDPNLLDEGGMRRAAYAEDTDAKPGCPVGASGLPHLAHAAASLMMALEQATVYELLPADPGQPWAERAAPTETFNNLGCTDRTEGWDCKNWLENRVKPEQSNGAADTFCQSCRVAYPDDVTRWAELDNKNEERRRG